MYPTTIHVRNPTTPLIIAVASIPCDDGNVYIYMFISGCVYRGYMDGINRQHNPKPTFRLACAMSPSRLDAPISTSPPPVATCPNPSLSNPKEDRISSFLGNTLGLALLFVKVCGVVVCTWNEYVHACTYTHVHKHIYTTTPTHTHPHLR